MASFIGRRRFIVTLSGAAAGRSWRARSSRAPARRSQATCRRRALSKPGPLLRRPPRKGVVRMLSSLIDSGSSQAEKVAVVGRRLPTISKRAVAVPWRVRW
jgi:hypothetical protein